jgi:hypothetical protein
MSDTHESTAGEPADNELLSRLRVIEDQPLESRAAAFAQIHEELQATLENADSPRVQ